jgi:hypothetical protein
MDLYTATPSTLDPLPFRGMSRYPYGLDERYPQAPEQQAYLRDYNTRILGGPGADRREPHRAP